MTGFRPSILPGILALLLACGAVGRAADMPVPDALDASFREWMEANHVSNAELAVMKNGRPARSFGYGGWTADQPEVVASLSKAVPFLSSASSNFSISRPTRCARGRTPLNRYFLAGRRTLRLYYHSPCH